jgi:hypothetical protein
MSAALGARLQGLDLPELRREFREQGAFLYLPQFLPAATTAELIAAVADVAPAIKRNYLPGHKQGGSVSRHAIDELAPGIAALYRSPALLTWLSAVAGEPLQVSPLDDPHAYALYFYTEPGDHIGWHYDTSYYAGRRYTVLIGVIDQSGCRAPAGVRRRRARCRSPRGDSCSSTATRCAIASRPWPRASAASRSRSSTSPTRACTAGAASSPT